jgi:uncharacterized membrane protein YgcG
MELVARGALALDMADGVSRPILRDGPRPLAPSEQALAAIWWVYRRCNSGTPVQDVARTASRQYGGLAHYVRDEVLPPLVERGLYARMEKRILWIIPTTRYELTAEGRTACAELQDLLKLGKQSVAGWATDDPNHALRYAGLAGAALLLQPDLFPDIRRAREYADDSGVAQVADFDSNEFDVTGFDLSDLGGGFDAALSAIDAAIDSGTSSGDGGGGADGGSGDSGGGGGDGGGGGE